MSTLTTTKLEFTEENGCAVAYFTALAGVNIHVEKDFKGDITVQQKTCSDSFEADTTNGFTLKYLDVYTLQNVLSEEFDYSGEVFPKKVKVICHNYHSGDTLPKGCYSLITA